MKTKSHQTLRLILRGLSALMILFFLFMFIGETFFTEKTGDALSYNAILQLSFMAIGMIGLGLAWKWELIGGIIAIISFIVLAIINPKILKSFIMLMYPLTAVLFIVLWSVSRDKL